MQLKKAYDLLRGKSRLSLKHEVRRGQLAHGNVRSEAFYLARV
jgi:hypothetical protein